VVPVASPAAAAPPATSGVLAFFAAEPTVVDAVAILRFAAVVRELPFALVRELLLVPLREPAFALLRGLRLVPLRELRLAAPPELPFARPLELPFAERFAAAAPRVPACLERPFEERVVDAIGPLPLESSCPSYPAYAGDYATVARHRTSRICSAPAPAPLASPAPSSSPRMLAT
jgi:hypothetical protein